MKTELEVQAMAKEQIPLVNEHLSRHILESGKHGVHWLPYNPREMQHPPSVKEECLDIGFGDPGWERWTIVVDSSLVVGHISLNGARFGWGVHRCELGMGLEQPYWRRGLGTALLATAIEKARSVSSIDWLDLHVLSLNEPGVSLYEKHGFTVTSRIEDFCRIEGKSADDIFMSLWVGATPPNE